MMDLYKKAFRFLSNFQRELKINKKMKHTNILSYKEYEIVDK